MTNNKVMRRIMHFVTWSALAALLMHNGADLFFQLATSFGYLAINAGVVLAGIFLFIYLEGNDDEK